MLRWHCPCPEHARRPRLERAWLLLLLLLLLGLLPLRRPGLRRPGLRRLLPLLGWWRPLRPSPRSLLRLLLLRARRRLSLLVGIGLLPRALRHVGLLLLGLRWPGSRRLLLLLPWLPGWLLLLLLLL